MTKWDMADAKARFNELLDQVEAEGPQIVVRGTQEFRIMTMEQLDHELSLQTPRISVEEFLLASRLNRPSAISSIAGS